MTTDREAQIRTLYAAFNDRDLDAVISAMTPAVDWPNGWEGGRLVGSDSVRQYWERQRAHVRPMTTVREVVERPDGTVAARVRMVIRDPAGTVLTRSEVVHVYEFAGPLVQRMTVEPEAARPQSATAE